MEKKFIEDVARGAKKEIEEKYKLSPIRNSPTMQNLLEKIGLKKEANINNKNYNYLSSQFLNFIVKLLLKSLKFVCLISLKRSLIQLMSNSQIGD